MRWFNCALALCLLPAAATAEMTRGHYTLYYQNLDVGELIITLRADGAHYRYEARGKPGRLAELFGKGHVLERGTVDGTHFLPLTYTYDDAGEDEHFRNVYNWHTRDVRIETIDTTETHVLTERVTDPVALTVRSILAGPELPRELDVISRGRMRTYLFDPPIKIETRDSFLWEVTSHEQSERAVRVVSRYAPHLANWLVTLERFEHGRSKYRIELARLERGSGPGDLQRVDQK